MKIRGLLLVVLCLVMGCTDAASPPVAQNPAPQPLPESPAGEQPGEEPAPALLDSGMLRPLQLDPALHEPWEAFLASPTEERFLMLRQLLVNSKGFDPRAKNLLEIDRLIVQERYADAAAACQQAMPNYLLSPRTHLHWALAADRLGDQERAASEGLAAAALLSGIEWTGDGTQDLPYLILHSDDAYDLLRFFGQVPTGEKVLPADGRFFVVLNTEDGRIWFDITDVMHHLQAS